MAFYSNIREQAGATRTTYAYDRENRLTSLLTGANRSTYTYNRDGLRRTAHEAGGTLATMIWDGDDYLGEV